MKQQELLNLGFKKKKVDDNYWFELKTGKHLFLTNDNWYNKGKDEWHIGYDNRKHNEDTFWFNQKLDSVTDFKSVFRILTGKEFKLTLQRGLVK